MMHWTRNETNPMNRTQWDEPGWLGEHGAHMKATSVFSPILPSYDLCPSLVRWPVSHRKLEKSPADDAFFFLTPPRLFTRIQ